MLQSFLVHCFGLSWCEFNDEILYSVQVKSKLDVLASYADAKIGLLTHGWITKIEKHGCFVKFYNGVQGFVSRLISNL
jgi:RecJ-like exonuclease